MHLLPYALLVDIFFSCRIFKQQDREWAKYLPNLINIAILIIFVLSNLGPYIHIYHKTVSLKTKSTEYLVRTKYKPLRLVIIILHCVWNVQELISQFPPNQDNRKNTPTGSTSVTTPAITFLACRWQHQEDLNCLLLIVFSFRWLANPQLAYCEFVK